MSSGVQSFIKETLYGYRLWKYVTTCQSVLLYGKGERLSSGARSFRKFPVPGFTYCTRDLDRSRRCNSFIFTGKDFARICEIYLLSGCDAGDSVHLGVQKMKVKSHVLISVGGVPVSFVEIESVDETCIVYARDIQKCIVLRCAQATYLCVLHRNGTLEAT